MSITIATDGEGRCRAVVEGSMTIYEAAADKSVLLDALSKTNEMEVDLGFLYQMDTAALQLLIVLKRESLRTGKVMRLIRHSAAALDVLDRYNLAAYFGDPVIMSHMPDQDRGTARGAPESRQ
jgi:anti-sigma B factor antagonist